MGIPFDVTKPEFDSRESAADWIDANQLGRRNLSPEQMSLLRRRRYNRAKKTHAEAGAMKGASDKMSSASTAEQLAEQHGVDARTIKREGKFAEAVEVLGMEDEVAAGELSAPKAAIVEAAKPLAEAKKVHDKWEGDAIKTPPEPILVASGLSVPLCELASLTLTGEQWASGGKSKNTTIGSHFCVSPRRAGEWFG